MYCAHWVPVSIDSVPGSSFDMELPKRGPKSLLEMIEHEISGKNYVLMKYVPFLYMKTSKRSDKAQTVMTVS